MRIPVAVSLESRDGTVTQDAKLLNGVVENRGDTPTLRKRPGFSDVGLIASGTAQLLYTWSGLNAIVGDSLYRGTQSSIVSSPASTTSISPSVAGLRFDAQEVGSSAATQILMIKNRTQAWTATPAGAISAVSFPSNMGAATYSVVSLTRSSTTATASLSTNPGLNIGDSITVAGAGQSAYNITTTVTAVNNILASTVSWNPLDKGAAVTLSNGNLTVTSAPSGTGIGAAVRANTGKSSGKWYWEVTLTDSVNASVGVANLSATLDSLENNSGNSWAWGSAGTAKYPGGGAYGSGFTIGDVIGVALDMTAGTLTFYQNGVSKGTAATGLSGTLYPIVASRAGFTTNTTANFGATSFAFAAPSGYSALQAASTFTVSYTVAGSPTTPATGTITLSTNGGMVPGLPYIDGYFFVMDNNGVMWQSAIDDPTSWPALNNLTAQQLNGKGKALNRAQNYLIAFKEWSTEFYYDAKIPNFAFLPVDNGFTEVGCAVGESVAHIDGTLVWLSQVKERGRSVHVMTGLQQQKVSTPDVERILNLDDLATVYAYGVKIGGHSFYVLTLVTSNITLVYDLSSQVWCQWSSLTLGSSVSVSSITTTSGVATVTTSTAHGLSDGDPVQISGANQSAYNGIFQASRVSSTVFTVNVTGSPATGTGTIVCYPYTSSYFKFTKYANYLGLNLFLHETNGHLYQMQTSLYQDAGIPIDLFFRTTRLDGGSSEVKVMARATVIGDKIGDTLMLRQSDDDCNTFSAYRTVDLSLERPSLRRLGKFRRRTIEGRHIGNTSPRIESLELEIPQ